MITLPNLPAGAKPLEMVLIPAGSFTMGCPSTEQGYQSTEWPPHEVTITQPFYLGKYEVTQAQWQAVMGTSPSYDQGVGNDYAVYNVSWDDCQSFIILLNDIGQGTFRLPTEAEWEFACRAGTTTRFSFGNALECADNDTYPYCEIYNQHMWWRGNNGVDNPWDGGWGPKEVGSKLPNPWRLFDMHGNMEEWCSDRWEAPYDRGPQIDPQGPSSGDSRVLRGGNWYRDGRRNRSASRYSLPPHLALRDWGVRLVRSYP